MKKPLTTLLTVLALLYALTHGLTAEEVGELLDSMDEDALL